MKAKESFAKNIGRCMTLLSIHKSKWPRRPAQQGDDLLRAIVMLAVSALDSYMHYIVLENAPQIAMAFANGKTTVPGKLLDSIKGVLTPERALRLVGRKRPDLEIRGIISEFIEERTFQNPGEIENALKLITIDDFWDDLRKRLGLRRKNQVKEYLVLYITRRHKIVHEADTYKGNRNHDKLRPISRPYTEECIKKVTKFTIGLDKVIAIRMRRVLGK